MPSATAYPGAPGTVRADNVVPETPTTRNSTSKGKNFKSDIDQQLDKEIKSNRNTNQKATGEQLPQQSLADSDSMTTRDVQQALLFYTDQEWVSYQRTHGDNADMEAFLRECWLPASANAKTDVRERYRIDSERVMKSLSEVMKEYHIPTLLHLICGQAKWKVVKVLDKPSGKYRIKANPGVVRFTGLEQVHATFEKRGELVKYLMRNHRTLYKRLPLSQEVPPPLIYALDKFKHLPVGCNPFLQLFVSEDPEESARQLDPFTQQGGEAQEEEEEPVDMEDGEEEEEEGEEVVESSQSVDAVAQVESQSVPDPGWIHELLPRICSADAVGLDCVTKLFPNLSKDRLALQSKEGNTVLHLAARYKYACDESKEAMGELLQVIKELVRKYPDAVGVLNKDGESPYLHRVKSYQAKEGLLSDILPDDPITFYLKQLCISQNEPRKTLKLLYAINDEKREREPRFYLNLSGATYYKKQFSRTRVESLLETLSLDNILKFVKIVPFTVLDDGTDADDDHEYVGLKETQFDGVDSSATLPHLEDGPPNNCEMIFDYLRNTTKVQAIYEVAVEESNIEDKKYPPHTDDAIAQCLAAPFSDHILTWDWQKIDICSELLCKVAPNVETLYLYSGGSNAILRSWSSAEGLIGLPNV